MNEINQIKFEKSYNDRFFVCFLNKTVPICLINNDLFEFYEIGCYLKSNYDNRYKVFYFKESDNFMLISIGKLATTIMSNYNDTIFVCGTKIYSEQSNAYSIIYNKNNNRFGYDLINYTNLSYFNQYKDMSILGKNKTFNYLEKIKNSIQNLSVKEELIEILNEFLNNKNSTNYIDENEELIIRKDEMKIAFTSTYIPNKNEKLNLTTIIIYKINFFIF